MEEWLANITNLKTRRAYKEDAREFIAFTGLQDYIRLRSVGRSHIISWRKDMERRGLAPASIRRKLSALSSLFDYLCERNAVTGNPADGVKGPMANGNEGSTPALGDAQDFQRVSSKPVNEERYYQETKALFGFFTSALSTLEWFFFAAYFVGHAAVDPTKISAGTVRARFSRSQLVSLFKQHFSNDSFTQSLVVFIGIDAKAKKIALIKSIKRSAISGMRFPTELRPVRSCAHSPTLRTPGFSAI